MYSLRHPEGIIKSNTTTPRCQIHNLLIDPICRLCTSNIVFDIPKGLVFDIPKVINHSIIQFNWRKNSNKYYNNNKAIISARRKLEYISRKCRVELKSVE